MVVVLVEL